MYYHTWYQHQYFPSSFPPFLFLYWKYIEMWGNLHHMDCIHIWLLKQTKLLALRVTWFLMCRPLDPDPLLFSHFDPEESPRMKFWIVESFYDWVFYFIFLGRVVFPCLQYESLIMFQDEYMIGSIRNSFPISYISWFECIHPSLLQ